MHTKTLASLSDHTPALVVDIRPGSLAPRLVEMGLCKGTVVVILFRAPFGGPLAVDIGDSIVSLRVDEAEQIVIAEEHNG